MNRKKKEIKKSQRGLYQVKTKLRAGGLFDQLAKAATENAKS